MRLNEVLTESAIQELNEGPFGQAVAGAARGLARGAGAVAGGISAIPGQVKKGYSAGAAAVRGEPEPATAAPASSKRAASAGNQQSAQQPAVAQGKEDTVYSQVKSLIGQLDKKGKQRILAALSKDLGSAPAKAAPAKTTAKAAPAKAPAGQVFSHSQDRGLGKQSDGEFIQPGQKFDTATGEPLTKSAPAAKKAGNPAAPAGTPAAKPKLVRGGRARAA